MSKNRKKLYHYYFDEIPNEFLNIDFKESSNNNDLGKDPYQTDEQYKRDILITSLLENYVDNYKNKSIYNRKYKLTLFIFCILFIIVLSVILLVLMLISVIKGYDNIALFIGSFVSLIGLPIGILKLITEYIFPKDEDKHITQIVKLTQQNDLKNKKANMEAEKNAK